MTDQVTENVTPKREGYFRVEDTCVDYFGKHIGLGAFGLLCYFKRRADVNGASFPSVQRIQKDFGIGSYNTIKKHIRTLERFHLLKVFKRGRRYYYQVLNPKTAIMECVKDQFLNTKDNTIKDDPNKGTETEKPLSIVSHTLT